MFFDCFFFCWRKPSRLKTRKSASWQEDEHQSCWFWNGFVTGNLQCLVYLLFGYICISFLFCGIPWTCLEFWGEYCKSYLSLYLLACLFACLLACLPACLLTCLLACLLTYSLGVSLGYPGVSLACQVWWFLIILVRSNMQSSTN